MTGLLNDYEENFVKFNEDLTILKNCFFFQIYCEKLSISISKIQKNEEKKFWITTKQLSSWSSLSKFHTQKKMLLYHLNRWLKDKVVNGQFYFRYSWSDIMLKISLNFLHDKVIDVQKIFDHRLNLKYWRHQFTKR